MALMVGWLLVMFNGVDAVGIDMQPQIDHGPYWTIFFMVFIVVGGFFILNLFVGVIISVFNKEKDKIGKNFLLTKR